MEAHVKKCVRFAFCVAWLFVLTTLPQKAFSLSGIATEPGPQEVDVSVFPTISVVFDEIPDASQIVLSLSLGDGLPVKCNLAGAGEDGKVLAFLPERRLNVNSTYTAMLSGFRDLHGNSFAPHVWIFRTREHDWVQVGSVGSALNGDASKPHAAINSHDDTAVVWELKESKEDGREEDNIYIKATVGSSILQPIRLNKYGAAYSPHVAINDNGDIIAVWQEQYGDSTLPPPSQIFLARKPANGDFQAVQWVNSSPDFPAAAGAHSPQIVLSRMGDTAFVVWEQDFSSTGNRAIYAAQCGIGEPACRLLGKLNSDDASNPSSPKLAVYSKNSVVFVWQETKENGLSSSKEMEMKIAARTYSQNLLGEVVYLGQGKNASMPDVSGSDAGDIFIVWQECLSACDASVLEERIYSVSGVSFSGGKLSGSGLNEDNRWLPKITSSGIPTMPMIKIAPVSRDASFVWQQSIPEAEGAAVFSSSFNLSYGPPAVLPENRMLMASGLLNAWPHGEISDDGFSVIVGLGKALTAAQVLDSAWLKTDVVYHQMLSVFGGETADPQLAMNAKGDALTVWTESTQEGSSKIGAALLN